MSKLEKVLATITSLCVTLLIIFLGMDVRYIKAKLDEPQRQQCQPCKCVECECCEGCCK